MPLCSAQDNSFHLFCFLDKVSHVPGWPRTCYVAKDDLELPVLVPPLLEGWDYKHVATIPCFCSAGDQTQGLLHTRQPLHHLSFAPANSSWFKNHPPPQKIPQTKNTPQHRILLRSLLGREVLKQAMSGQVRTWKTEEHNELSLV